MTIAYALMKCSVHSFHMSLTSVWPWFFLVCLPEAAQVLWSSLLSVLSVSNKVEYCPLWVSHLVASSPAMQTPNNHITGWKQASLCFLNICFLKTGSVGLDDYDVKQGLILYVFTITSNLEPYDDNYSWRWNFYVGLGLKRLFVFMTWQLINDRHCLQQRVVEMSVKGH